MSYAILYGSLLAILDTLSLPLAKYSYVSGSIIFLIIAMIVSVTQIGIFYKAMAFTSLTILNLSWDLISDSFVTIYGIFILKEAFSTNQLIGVLLSFISLYLMK